MTAHKIFSSGNRHAVYAVDSDGYPQGAPLGVFDDLPQAESRIAEIGNSIDDFTSKIRDAFAKKFSNDVVDWWVPDVFDTYVVAKNFDEGHWKVPFTLDENGNPDFAPRSEWQRVIVDYRVVSETHPLAHDEDVQFTFVSEFRGSYPDVPFAEGVDRATLEAGDDDPMYLTLPVAKVGAVSRSKLRHTPEFVSSVVSQINDYRPGGIMGHIKLQDRSTLFPVSDIHWVGATLAEDGTAWAKGYIPNSKKEVRKHYQLEKAKGGKAAISLYGIGPRHAHQNGDWTPKPFTLEAVDLAPWQRAALPLTGDFELTSEMVGDSTPPPTEPEESNMPQDIKWDDIKLEDIPQTVVEMVMAANPPAPPAEPVTPPEVVSQITGLTSQVETMQTIISELQATNEALRKSQFEASVDQLVAEYTDWNTAGVEAAEKALETLRKGFKTALVAEFNARMSLVSEQTAPDDLPDLTTIAAELWAADHEPMAEAVKLMIAGGRVTTSAKPRPQGGVTKTAAEMAADRAALGF
jgi:hypothetical protein